MTRTNLYLTIVFIFSLVTMVQAAEIGTDYQLRLKSPAGVYPTESNLTVKVQVLSIGTGCVLREEVFSNQNIVEGNLSVSIGSGARGGLDPNLTFVQIFDNSKSKSGLSCVDSSGSLLSSGQTYTPVAGDHRLIRFYTSVSSESVIAEFPMKSVGYASQAESVGGKLANELISENTATALNQTNLENLLFNSTKLSILQNIADGGAVPLATSATTASNATNAINATNAVTASQVSGAFAGDISGNQNSITVDKIKNVTVSSALPASGQVLQFNGSQYVPSTLPSAPVNSVAGRTGHITLSTADISGLGSYINNSNVASGDVTGTFSNLIVNSVGGANSVEIANSVVETNTATSVNTASTLVKRDGSGNIAVGTVSSSNVSTNNIYLYESTNSNSIRLQAPNSFSNYVLTLPTTAGAAGQFLKSDGLGNLSWATPVAGTGTVTSVIAGTGLSGGTITNTGTISLSNTAVTPGSYGSASQVGQFSVDAQGRLNSATQVNIALPSSQITQSGASSGQVLKWNGSAWVASADSDTNSGGTVTSVSSANSYLTVANGTLTPSLTVNVGATSGTLAAGDDLRITGALQSSVFNSYIASANCLNDQTMYWNSVSSTFTCQTIGTVANAVSATQFTGSISGDVTGFQNVTSVTKIRGVPVNSAMPNTNEVLVFNGTEYVPKKGLPRFVRITTDLPSFTTTALSNATGLTFAVSAGVSYKYKFTALYTAAATTTGLRIGLTYPAATTASALAHIPGATADGTAFLFSGFISSSGDSVMATTSPNATPTVMMAYIEGVITPSAAGNVQLQAASEVAGSAVVIKAGSFIEIAEMP